MGGTDAPAPARNPFPFQHKPNTLDRDRIVVPAGWDSWGKISVLREGFDANFWGGAWENDLEEVDGQGSGETGAKKLFAALVPDQGEKVCADNYLLFTTTKRQHFCSLTFFHLSTIQCQNKHFL
jgi:hypothetical protein